MTAFAILVKSYRGDLAYAERLLNSFERHNPDGIPLHLVVPDVDLEEFAHLASLHVTLLGESAFAPHLVSEPVNGYETGYINQEIIKLAFWETGLADNYLCLDSDAEIIRDLNVNDFMHDDETPYTFLSEDAELRVEPDYYESHWRSREVLLERIRQEVGLTETRLLTVHGHAVFSARVLKGFRDRFLEPRGWDYKDALAVAPFEPTWYNMWLLKDQTIPIVMREPVIKTFHNPTQQLDYVLRGVSTEDVARGYVAIVVNSNYSRSDGLASLSDSPESALASFVTTRELFEAMRFRLHQQVIVEKTPYRRARRGLGAKAAGIPWLRKYVDLG